MFLSAAYSYVDATDCIAQSNIHDPESKNRAGEIFQKMTSDLRTYTATAMAHDSQIELVEVLNSKIATDSAPFSACITK